MRTTVLLSLALAGCVLAHRPLAGQTLRPEITQDLLSYVTLHYQTPEEYVLAKFKDHDIVFLGEWHRIRHDPELVQRLIPLLPPAGVRYLGFEFARRVDQGLIDSLLNGPEYDEHLARLIVFRNFVFWGYQEYVDIFRAAWNLNHFLPAHGRRLRILGLNNAPDWSVVKKEEDRNIREVMLKVWHGETEEDWAKVLLDTVIGHGEKALVYCGIHHAFTAYRQPLVLEGKFVRFGDVRLGNYVFRRIGERAFTIFLHSPWAGAGGYDSPQVLPADGYIDALLEEIAPEYRRLGFDLHGTPFGKLPGETGLYKFGYDHFTLETFCDGYICQGPFSAYRGVTPIKDFVNEKNLAEARAQSPNPWFRNATIENLNAGIAEDADIPRRLSVFK